MAKPPIVEEEQLNHAIAVAGSSGQTARRDVALLLVAYCTGMTPNEIAKLVVSDYLEVDGTIRTESALREEISFNGRSRPVYWTNRKVRAGVDSYLAFRTANKHGTNGRSKKYRGLNADGPLFLTADGRPLTFTKRVTTAGTVSFSCESLTEIYRRLHMQAGIENGNASSARRTFAVRLYRQGRDLKLIRDVLGVNSLSAVKNLVEGDSRHLSAMVAEVL